MIENIFIALFLLVFLAAIRTLFKPFKNGIGINYVTNKIHKITNTKQTEPMTNFITTLPPNAHIPTKTKNQRQKRKLKKQVNNHTFRQ